MLKKTLTYENLDGESVTEDFYFQITKSEVTEKALIEGKGYLEQLQALSVERDGAKIIHHFKEILGSAVGRRDGQLFIKNEDIRKHFMYSGAYDTFFMEMLTSGDSGASVIRAMLPKDVQATVDEQLAKQNAPAGTTELPASAPQLESVAESTDDVVQLTATEAQVQTSVSTPEPGKDDPAWLKELRTPTPAEMRGMSKDDIALAMKMREAGALAS